MELPEIEREMARVDAVYRQVANKPVEHPDLDTLLNMGARIEQDLAQLGVDDQAEAVLQAVIGMYASGSEAGRAAIRGLFDRYPSFSWAGHPPRDWRTPPTR